MLTRLERTHKRFRTDNFSRLLSPALELLESIPPLESGSNRPLDFDFSTGRRTRVHAPDERSLQNGCADAPPGATLLEALLHLFAHIKPTLDSNSFAMPTPAKTARLLQFTS